MRISRALLLLRSLAFLVLIGLIALNPIEKLACFSYSLLLPGNLVNLESPVLVMAEDERAHLEDLQLGVLGCSPVTPDVAATVEGRCREEIIDMADLNEGDSVLVGFLIESTLPDVLLAEDLVDVHLLIGRLLLLDLWRRDERRCLVLLL